MTYVTLSDGTPCRVDTSEGDAWELTYDERRGEERWMRMQGGERARDAFRLAEMGEAAESAGLEAA